MIYVSRRAALVAKASGVLGTISGTTGIIGEATDNKDWNLASTITGLGGMGVDTGGYIGKTIMNSNVTKLIANARAGVRVQEIVNDVRETTPAVEASPVTGSRAIGLLTATAGACITCSAFAVYHGMDTNITLDMNYVRAGVALASTAGAYAISSGRRYLQSLDHTLSVINRTSEALEQDPLLNNPLNSDVAAAIVHQNNLYSPITQWAQRSLQSLGR